MKQITDLILCCLIILRFESCITYTCMHPNLISSYKNMKEENNDMKRFMEFKDPYVT